MMASLIQQPVILRLVFSRSSQCCCRPSTIPLRIPRRLFSHTSLRAAKKQKKPVVNKPSHALNTFSPKSPPRSLPSATASTPATPPTLVTYKSYATQLASKPSPTLLYESPVPLVHMTASYLLGGFCIGYGVWNCYAQIIHPLHSMGPVGTSLWGAICVAMGFFGLWSISASYRMVHTITALQGTPLRVTLTSHPMLPFLRPRPKTALCTSISTSAPLYKPQVTAIPLTRSQRVAEQMERQRQWDQESQRLLTLPFREAKRYIRSGLGALKDLYVRENTVYVRVEGSQGSWKLQKGVGYSVEGGKAWDRLVKVNVLDEG